MSMNKKLWLWKNPADGSPEYIAFNNQHPCHQSGDPIVIGEPCGLAVFMESVNGRADDDAIPKYAESNTDEGKILAIVNMLALRKLSVDAKTYRALLSRLGQPAVDALMDDNMSGLFVRTETDCYREEMFPRLDKPQSQKEE